jgi:predicted phage terminase large subunit-like protein
MVLSRVEIEAERVKRDFALFVKLAWPIIEPGTPYVPGWHLDALILHLEALARGTIKRLLVNMPPRHAKSSIISVLWPVWMWVQNPSIRFLCASYDMPLAVRDNRKCRLLIRSEWFQERFGSLFQLRRDQNQKENFENNQAGYRVATSVGGGTGKGGDILIIDDPHPIEQKKGGIGREKVLDWFKDTWSTRLNDQQTGCMIVVGQRVHDQDLSGYILAGSAGEEWVHLNLPAEYDAGSACRTYIGGIPKSSESVKVNSFTNPLKSYEVTFEEGRATSCTCEAFTYHPEKLCKHMRTAKAPVSVGKLLWADPRTEQGELLWEERFPREVIEKEKRVHGPLGYAALYDQRPVPASGNIYDKNNARYFTIDWPTETYLLETPRGIKTVPMAECWKFCTVDPAISEKETADFFVMAAYAVTPWRDLLLLEIVRDHFPLPKQEEQMVLFQQKHEFQFWAVESVAFQLGLIQLALTRGVPCQPFKAHSDKVIRSSTASIWDSNGKFYAYKEANWLFVYEKEIYTFPKAAKDDQADTKAMAAIVVCTTIAPGVWDPNSTENTVEDDRAIEEILDATQIAEERRLIEEQTKVDPWYAFADKVFAGGDW